MAERPLRILQVSTADKKGGAEGVAWRLFTAYRARGYSSWLAVGQKRSDDPDVFVIPNRQSQPRWYYFWQDVSSSLRRMEARLSYGTTLSGLAASLSDPCKWLNYHLGVEDFHFPGTTHLLSLPQERPDVLH